MFIIVIYEVFTFIIIMIYKTIVLSINKPCISSKSLHLIIINTIYDLLLLNILYDVLLLIFNILNEVVNSYLIHYILRVLSLCGIL